MMKKILAIVLILAALSITLAACSEKTEIKSDEQAKETVTNLTGDLDSLGESLDNLNEKLS